ncbi:maf-like protein DDB_G0281937 isoform X5 [Carica papaya]|uniref:maf-like protein DDB_G0281937 isoform X5 n=1 Tax=Carica papaya TaxID=3649 RepID=UPI000B8CCE33|nr:maf-like protein DDB_G0281937 isoform X5 [Carica papaya]
MLTRNTAPGFSTTIPFNLSNCSVFLLIFDFAIRMEANASPFKLILGSSSIARRQILADMGYEFTVMIADIDEKCIRKEKPEDLVMALAEAKADAIVSKLQTVNNQELDSEAIFLIAADTVEPIMQRLPIGDSVLEADPKLLITCDQVVVYEGVIREKPSCEEEAREFIKGYSGRNAATVSSVMITNLKTGIRKGQWDRVQIYFHEIPDEVIEKLIKEGLVLKVAGALIIEHPLILPYIKQVLGTTDSVMGLPKALVQKLIKESL